ncbi:hypothetical protein ACP4OV_018149 [Aristida adscensionis]
MDATTAGAAFPGTSFVILSVSIVGILSATLLLLAYYLFLTRCGLRFFAASDDPGAVAVPPSAPHHHHVHVVAVHERRGLEEAAIRRIPTFRYRRSGGAGAAEVKAGECAVCLAEFADGERLRLLPPCLHAFHIDCIDAWLHATATCPLCRAAIAADHHLAGALPAEHGRRRGTDGNDDDIVIDIPSAAVDEEPAAMSPVAAAAPARDARRKRKNGACSSCSMGGGDRRIEMRGGGAGDQGEEELSLPLPMPMRRSLSMDSCSDKRFYLALQRILQQQQQQQQQQLGSPAVREDDGKAGESSAAAAAGRSRRLRRSFFSFSQSRSSSRSAATVLPL